MPCHDKQFSGWIALKDILNGNPRRCKENFRIKLPVIFQLCKMLVEQYGLEPTSSVTVEEQVATFLLIVGPRVGNRQLQELFQRFGFMISRSFHRVLKACTKMAMDWVRPFHNFSVTHPYFQQNSRFFPHFKDCIGAIDGTHVRAVLPEDKKLPFIGRKGIPTQNILAVCDFDMHFTFALSGWEGSAHDTRIFLNTI